MADDLNKVLLLGRLGRDPEMKYTPNGTAVVNFSMATSESWKDKNTGEKNERTEWHRITAWRRLAEICGEYLKKGSQVLIEGKLQTRSWEDQEGNTRYMTEVVAHYMKMLGSRQSQGQSQGPPTSNEPEDEDIPF